MSVFGYMRCDVSECCHNFAQRGVFPMSQMSHIRIRNKIRCQIIVPCKNLMFVGCWKGAVLEKRQSVKSSNLYERSNQEQCSLECQGCVRAKYMQRYISHLGTVYSGLSTGCGGFNLHGWEIGRIWITQYVSVTSTLVTLGYGVYLTSLTEYEPDIRKPPPKLATPSTNPSHLLFIGTMSNTKTVFLHQFPTPFSNNGMMRQAPQQNAAFREKTFTDRFWTSGAAMRNESKYTGHCPQKNTGEVEQ